MKLYLITFSTTETGPNYKHHSIDESVIIETDVLDSFGDNLDPNKCKFRKTSNNTAITKTSKDIESLIQYWNSCWIPKLISIVEMKEEDLNV